MSIFATNRGRMIVSTIALALVVGLAGCEANDAPVIDTSTPESVKQFKLERVTAPGSAEPPTRPHDRRTAEVTKSDR
jgi:hypothetical protein